MKKLQEYLEQDKERFLSTIANLNKKDTVIKEVRAEYDRILYGFNEQELSAKIKETVSYLMQVAKSSADLIDCNGKSVIYSRVEYGSRGAKGKRSWIFYVLLIIGLVLMGLCGAYIYIFLIHFDDTNKSLMLLAGVLVSQIILFIAGILSHRKSIENKDDLYAEVAYDPQKVYQNVLAVVLVADKLLSDISVSETIELKKELQETKGGVNNDEVELLAQLLESAYGTRGEDASEEVISQIKYYLHVRHIELMDYDSEHASFFDKMPSPVKGTFRPAFVLDGVLMKKGLASGD